jgi:hypothetical protein
MGLTQGTIGHHPNRQNFPGRKPHSVAAFEDGWAVFDADGVRVSKRLFLRQYANDLRRQMDADLTPVRGDGVRSCMCCTQPFESAGPHNRLCKYCRHIPSNPFDSAYGTSRPSGISRRA